MSEQAKKPAKKKVELDPRFANYRHVWVFIESERGVVHPVSWELLGEGRKLVDALGVDLCGVVICGPGEPGQGICGEAFQYGADQCYLIRDEVLRDYRNDPYTKALTDLVNTHQPEVLMLGATTLGRGLKNQENFRHVRELAQVLGAEVGASRPVVQAGWAELDRQVGQSGKTVRPKLYIAAGISGAIQHRVGMDGADVIIAINSDPNAPIFDFAHYGLVGNAMAILPALTEAFKSHLAQAKKTG